MFRFRWTLCVIFFVSIFAQADDSIYRDSNQPIEKRVESLLSQMTLKEKAMQLTQGRIGKNDNPNNIEKTKQRFNPIIGSYICFQTDVNIRNEYQRRAIEETRLGIPLLFAYDVIHGFRTVYQISLGQACSFNTNIVEQAVRVAAKEASQTGINWTFSPMIDVARDPRWGRVSEGYGEDPLLNADFCRATIRGYQGDDLTKPDTLASCMKHYVGYSESLAGIDYAYTDISERAMWDTYLPPYKAGIEEGAATIMSGFNDINGIPAVCHQFYLTEVLRNRWGFDGVVVSDWAAIRQLKNQGFSKNPLVQGAASLIAGNDIDMMSEIYMRIPKMVNQGLLTEDVVDEAVRRVLRLKFRLGLFENPFTEWVSEKDRYLQPEYMEIAEKLAVESIVLLKNENILPVTASNKKIAVVGNLLDDHDALLGFWSAHGRGEDVIGIQDGLDLYKPNGITFTDDLDEADMIVLCIGEEQKMSGENASRSTIKLHNEYLVDQYSSYQKPIVLVVTAGRPISYQSIESKVDAILHMWQPGVVTGTALAKILYGIENPSAKLAMTFPRTVGQIPIFYNRNQSARVGNGDWSGLYQDIESTPMYEFGYGLSYTSFTYSNLVINEDTLEAQVTISNTGDRSGKEPILWFVLDPEASITQPIKKLKSFDKVFLKPGESKTITLSLDKNIHLSYFDFQGNSIFEAGTFGIEVGGLTKTFKVD